MEDDELSSRIGAPGRAHAVFDQRDIFLEAAQLRAIDADQVQREGATVHERDRAEVNDRHREGLWLPEPASLITEDNDGAEGREATARETELPFSINIELDPVQGEGLVAQAHQLDELLSAVIAIRIDQDLIDHEFTRERGSTVTWDRRTSSAPPYPSIGEPKALRDAVADPVYNTERALTKDTGGLTGLSSDAALLFAAQEPPG